MRNLPPEERLVYCFAGKGPSFGTGHMRRMKALSELLHSVGIKSKLVTQQSEIDSCPAAIVFDRRDESLSDEIIKLQLSSIPVVALDNRGPGRGQAGQIYDTLPHPDMNTEEINISIGRILLASFFSEKPTLAHKARLHIISESDIKAGIFEGEKTLLHKPGIEIDQFQQKLFESEKVITYFGQTLFEAIYCGKEIHVYGMTDYHRHLAQWFTTFWNSNQSGHYFDGKGTEKLISFIGFLIKSN
ncbi:MAG: hypothetical protein ABUK01_03815 [Leptospirales bacterium]